MFDFLKNKKEINTTQIIDEIEAAVYVHIKPYGFKKHGRTLHRFVSECSERSFQPNAEKKKYYHEYDCTMRSRLGNVMGKKEKWYDLRKPTKIIIKDILMQIQDIVLPAFDTLASREEILAHRKDYPWLDTFGAELLDDCMIYGHLGNIEKAKQLFEEHYQSAVDEYNDLVKNGRKYYLKKGQRVVFMEQDITAEKDGYVTLYGANHGHIDYLDELAVTLGLR